ncbi:protein kinase [Myxococcota bacterium]|nr:protein kinase [Myxococcota bacterium]
MPDQRSAPPAVPGPAPADRDPMVGRLIAGRYRVESLLARGGMGSVYVATQQPLGRQVALKILGGTGGHADDAGFQRRFLQEAATLARLRHPNTVTLFDYGVLEEEQLAYMVMELVRGFTLAQVLRREGRLSPARALWVAHEVARALGEAHGLGIVHRDLKPGNVMLATGPEGEQVKVLDFGIAKLLEEDAHALTGAENLVGSPGYMAPEQITHRPIDGRTDIYALGVQLYTMLTGTQPFAGRNAVESFVAHLHRPAPTLQGALGAPVAPALEALVARCLAKEPDHRFADVAELRAAIRGTLAELDPAAASMLAAAAAAPPRADPSAGGGTPPPGPADTARLARPRTLDRPAHLVAQEGVSTPTLQIPAEPAPRSRAMLVGAVAGLALLALVVVVTGALALRGLAPRPAATPASSATPDAALAPDAPPAPAEDPPAVPVQLRSVPPGAGVLDGEVAIGITPLDLTMPHDQPRRLVLVLDGYEDAPVLLTPGDPGGLREIRMVPAPRAPTPRRDPPPSSPPPTSPPPPDLDIRTTR